MGLPGLPLERSMQPVQVVIDGSPCILRHRNSDDLCQTFPEILTQFQRRLMEFVVVTAHSLNHDIEALLAIELRQKDGKAERRR